MRVFLLCLLAALLSACAVTRAVSPVKIGLLAPFEGRYREIGYNALYAARLALADAGDESIELLAVDDGGTIDSAAARGRALATDPGVLAVVAFGYDGADAATQHALGDLPMLIVGSWATRPVREGVFVLANPRLSDLATAPTRVNVTEAAALPAPVAGGEIFALAQFAKLRVLLDGVTVVSSGNLPSVSFSDRYRGGDTFAPTPGLLATLTYDAFAMIARQIGANARERDALADGLAGSSYDGLNGTIRFAEGYWADAPINIYRYDEIGELRAVDNVVEQR